MDWGWLILAGLLEVGWAVSMMYTDSFRKLWPTLITLITMFASVYCLTLALRSIPLGTGYTVWTGIGAVGTVLLGIVLFNESANLLRIIFVAIILLGIVGLKLSGEH
ncbi:multidrug efflux SMR transporter [Telmatocola sphagniphila]|jgi:quaternary ammonium compound-resistance protein SugE|uniref:Guanidinium exporter n=1 Tax=Telmatocola sphagniphila TaxID=1123043 RepID=A0A8E6EXA9_9BACT|nr:multidrug efflux SMR transporter [Telmatocola sphagniphila]